MTVAVIDHNPHSTDAEMKSKEKLEMHSLKQFRPDGMNNLVVINLKLKMTTANLTFKRRTSYQHGFKLSFINPDINLN